LGRVAEARNALQDLALEDCYRLLKYSLDSSIEAQQYFGIRRQLLRCRMGEEVLHEKNSHQSGVRMKGAGDLDFYINTGLLTKDGKLVTSRSHACRRVKSRDMSEYWKSII